MSGEKKKIAGDAKPAILAAIHTEELWDELSELLSAHFKVRREKDGLRAMEVLPLLKPVAVIAETDLPGLSGILLARLILHNRYLTDLPVALILSREYLIEEFWARDSGVHVTVPGRNAGDVVNIIKYALVHGKVISDEDWDLAEKALRSHGGPAAGVANELEKQLIGASVLARLGEIDITEKTPEGKSVSTIPGFTRQALAALSSILEFAQAGVTLFRPNKMFVIENDVFAEILDRDAFIRESQSSASIYKDIVTDSIEPEVINLQSVSHELPGPRGPASTFFALPLAGREGIYGLLSIMTYKEIAVREYYLHTLSLIGSQLAVTLERALLYEELRRLSITDPLTGLSNRRMIQSKLEDEFRRSVRYHTPLSVAICDIDDFKLVNDTHGHQTGDEVLVAVSEILKQSVREVDLAGRWGGEEMSLLFPQTDLTGALIACERIREQVADFKLDVWGTELSTTLSIGVATINTEDMCPRCPDSLIGLADSAMYHAKEHGKNQVASFLELPDALPSRQYFLANF